LTALKLQPRSGPPRWENSKIHKTEIPLLIGIVVSPGQVRSPLGSYASSVKLPPFWCGLKHRYDEIHGTYQA
jgi:hypothetical protein